MKKPFGPPHRFSRREVAIHRRLASPKTVILIDGKNWVYRHGFTRVGLTSDGRPTGAVHGCIQGLLRLAKFYPNAAFVVCWDGRDTTNSWRHRLCPSYKSNRTSFQNEKTEQLVKDIRKQIPYVKTFLRIFGLQQFSVPCLEADDLIGVLATSLKKRVDRVLIYSTDKDFYQLIGGPVQVIRDTDKSKNAKEISVVEIRKQFGVVPKQWLRYRAFVGDKGDHIEKPVRGIGEKRALELLASGVDASKKTPHPDFAKVWPKIRLAYKLSKIVRVVSDPVLPRVTQIELKSIVKRCKGDLYRDASIRASKKSYRKMLSFLHEFDLAELIRQSSYLWKIR